jgi:hypothetical protein
MFVKRPKVEINELINRIRLCETTIQHHTQEDIDFVNNFSRLSIASIFQGTKLPNLVGIIISYAEEERIFEINTISYLINNQVINKKFLKKVAIISRVDKKQERLPKDFITEIYEQQSICNYTFSHDYPVRLLPRNNCYLERILCLGNNLFCRNNLCSKQITHEYYLCDQCQKVLPKENK